MGGQTEHRAEQERKGRVEAREHALLPGGRHRTPSKDKAINVHFIPSHFLSYPDEELFGGNTWYLSRS